MVDSAAAKQINDTSLHMEVSLGLRALAQEGKNSCLRVSLPSQEKCFYLENNQITSFQSLPAVGYPLFFYLRKLKLVSTGALLEIIREKIPSNEEMAERLAREGEIDEEVINQALYTIQQRLAAKKEETPWLAKYLFENDEISEEERDHALALWQNRKIPFSEALAEVATVKGKSLTRDFRKITSHAKYSLPRVGEILYEGRRFSRETLEEILRESFLEGLPLREVILLKGLASFAEMEEIAEILLAKLEKPSSVPRLGELLIAQGKVTREEVEVALEEQRENNQYLGEIFLAKNYITSEELRQYLDRIEELEKQAYVPTSLHRYLVKKGELEEEKCRALLASLELKETEGAEKLIEKGLINEGHLHKILLTYLEDELFSLMVYPEVPLRCEEPFQSPENLFDKYGFSEDIRVVFSNVFQKLPTSEKDKIWTLGPSEVFYLKANSLGEIDFSSLPVAQREEARQILEKMDGQTPLDDILAETHFRLWDSYPLLRKLEEAGQIGRYSEEDLLSKGEKELKEGRYNQALDYYQLLEKGVKHHTLLNNRIPHVQTLSRKRKTTLFAVVACLVLLLSGTSLYFLLPGDGDEPRPPGKERELTPSQLESLQRARELVAEKEGQKAAAIYQKLLDQGVAPEKIRFPFYIQTQPPGARVYLGDQLLGKTSSEGLRGVYPLKEKMKFRVEKKNFAPHEFVLKKGQWFKKKITLTLQPLWEYKTGYPASASPWIGPDKILAPSREGVVYAFSRKGKLLWQRKVGQWGDILLTPQVKDNRVFLANRRGQISSLELETGREQWKATLPEALSPQPPLILSRGNGPQIVVGAGKKVYLIEGEDGRFSHIFSARHEIVATPHWKAPYIYVGSRDNALYAYHLPSGKLSWRVETGGDVTLPVATLENFVYAISGDKEVYKIQRFSGQIVEKKALSQSVRRIFRLNQRVYLLQDRGIVSLKEDLSTTPILAFQEGTRSFLYGDYMTHFSSSKMVEIWNLTQSQPLWKGPLESNWPLDEGRFSHQLMVTASSRGSWTAYQIPDSARE